MSLYLTMRHGLVAGTSIMSACVASLGCASKDDAPTSVLAEELQAKATLGSSNPTLCWVQDEDSTLSNAAFLALTADADAKILQWEAGSGLRFNFIGRCSGDANSAPSNSNYPEHIRVHYNEFSRESEYAIPGRGCSRDNGNGNNAYYPGNNDARCEWNATVKNLSNNNLLHEIGHAIGMVHEHERSDNTSGCSSSGADNDGIWLTDYDLWSVMHYNSAGCSVHTGLSSKDLLGAEIAYPSSSNVGITHNGLLFNGEFAVLPTSFIKTTWDARGAQDFVFDGITWSIAGGSTSNNVALAVSGLLDDGESGALSVEFEDPWGRTKTGSAPLLVSATAHAAVLMHLL
jgi:hypothetical protein